MEQIQYDMSCGECEGELDMGLTFKHWDCMLWYVCPKCNVSQPMRGL